MRRVLGSVIFFSTMPLLIRFKKGFLPVFLLISAALQASPLLTSDQLRSRMVLEAFRRAYPGKIESIDWREDDWTITVGGKVFYWAQGRLLPEKERKNWARYRPYVFYAYPLEPKDPKKYSKERIDELRAIGERAARLNAIDQPIDFRAALYGGRTRADAESKLVKAPLFGRTVSVHRDIADAIRRINATIIAAADRDPEIALFISGIGSLGGYNWREIRGTARRSYHSWGLAVDVQPKRLGKSVMYWEWERARNDDWMLVPLEKRWMPPLAVIEAFEREGFVWGGKWDLYDNMHFEYRPELHELEKVFAFGGGPESFISSLRRERGAAYPGLGGGEFEERP